MSEETNKSAETESSFTAFGQRISVRAIVVLMLVFTVCVMSILGDQVREPLYTLAGSAAGFYFGNQTQKKQ